MKKGSIKAWNCHTILKFVLCTLLLVCVQGVLMAQNPGGVSNSVLWLKANTGVTGATSVSQWIDQSGEGNHATQATAASQPQIATNRFNFNPALQFDGINHLMTMGTANFPAGNAARSCFFVASENGKTGLNSWLFSYGGGAVGTGWSPGKLTASTSLYVSGISADAQSLEGFWPSPINNNLSKLGGIVHDGASNNSFYNAGTAISTAVKAWNTTAANGYIGTLVGYTSERWKGQIAEIIFYPTEISTTERLKIESYLAMKYGIHKSGNYVSSNDLIIWNATTNAAYHNNVFGIALDNVSLLTQTSSNSVNTGGGSGTGQAKKGNIVISNPSLQDDGDFLIVGNNADLLAETTFGSPLVGKRVTRIWQAQHTGDVGTVSLSYDTLGFSYSGTRLCDYVLLVDSAGGTTFTGSRVAMYPATSIAGTTIHFDQVGFPSGSSTFTIRTLVALSATLTTDVASVCNNGPLPQLTFTGSGGTTPYTFTYNINGGASQIISTSGTNQSVTLPVPTNVADAYIYTITNIKEGSTTCDQVQNAAVAVAVNALPEATFSNNTTICNGESSTLTISLTGTAPWTIVYNMGTGGITIPVIASSSYELIVTPSATTTYTITRVEDANCINSAP